MIEKDTIKCQKLVNNLGNYISQGGYGRIHSLKDNPNVVVKIAKKNTSHEKNHENKCISGKGCENDILLEGLIMQKLNTLNCKHFIKFKALYNCDDVYMLLMEKLNGTTYTEYIASNKLSEKEKLTILFQITYALYKANEKMNFVHGDLIGKNIFIENVPEEDYEYIIDNKKIYVSNSGLRVVLFDFGFSRLNFKNWKFYKENKLYKNDEELFDSTADICKIYSNPNFKNKLFKETIVRDNISIFDLIQSCKSTGWSYIPIAPFPEIKAIDILRSNLFDQLYKKISLSSLKLEEDDIGMEPLYEGKISIKNWLNEDKNDNIVVYLSNNKTPFCLKRSYFKNPRVEQIFVECVYENNNLLNLITYEGNEYINIGYYLGEKYIIDRTLIKNTLKSKKNSFIITETPLVSKYIVKESLLMSTLELMDKKQLNKKNLNNLKYSNIDVYFDELYIKSLKNYSYLWDSVINEYLLKGDVAFESEWFLNNYQRYQKYGVKVKDSAIITPEEAIENVKERITNIDRCFLDFAPRNNSNNLLLYRGMKNEYIKGMKVGDSFEIKNYVSTSKYQHKSYYFTNKVDCCMYLLEVERGIPYIDMISSSKYKDEDEILLPRGLIATCTDIRTNSSIKTFVLHISLKNKDQFVLPSGCYNFKNVEMKTLNKVVTSKKVNKVVPVKKVKKVSSPVKKVSSPVKKVSSPVKKVSSPVKKVRCPKGSRRNKKTGNCDKLVPVPTHTPAPAPAQAPSSAQPQQVKKRCPKGSRRNKKTGNCDKY